MSSIQFIRVTHLSTQLPSHNSYPQIAVSIPWSIIHYLALHIRHASIIAAALRHGFQEIAGPQGPVAAPHRLVPLLGLLLLPGGVRAGERAPVQAHPAHEKAPGELAEGQDHRRARGSVPGNRQDGRQNGDGPLHGCQQSRQQQHGKNRRQGLLGLPLQDDPAGAGQSFQRAGGRQGRHLHRRLLDQPHRNHPLQNHRRRAHPTNPHQGRRKQGFQMFQHRPRVCGKQAEGLCGGVPGMRGPHQPLGGPAESAGGSDQNSGETSVPVLMRQGRRNATTGDLCIVLSQQIQLTMAFVCRAERKTDLSKPAYVVGPGTYESDPQRENKIPKAFVPFGSMETRSRDNSHKQASLPGPGSYNIADNQNGEKIVVSSETEDIKILEISRPNPVFKSGTQRFSQPKEEDISPGPGEYAVPTSIVQRPKIYSTGATSSKPKIIEHLININKYQSIPSIPSNIHAYGYNENENNELQLNEPPIEVYKGEKEDRVGPGHYNVTSVTRTKGTSTWSQAREKKIEEVKPAHNVGPGSYDVKTMQSLYSYKPSAGFASKTMRTMDQRKGAISQYQAAKRPEQIIEDNASSASSKVQSRVLSEKAPPSTMIDDDSSDDEYEYIDDTTPGPGSYLEISDVKKFNRPSRPAAPCFGVGQKRFGEARANSNNVGPGSYNPKKEVKKNFSKKKPVPVPKDIMRFPELVNTKKVEEPGPGAYEPRNTMEDKLIYKIQRGYRGQFGSTQVRSKEPEDEELPGPGEYNPQPYTQEKEALSVFKSTTKRKGIENSNQVPAPGVYNVNNTDIATRVIKEEEDDPDLIIKKPGFGVGEQRFKEAPKRDEEFDDDDIIKEIQDKYREEKKRKMLKNSAAFKSGQPRLKDTKNIVPGPGSYYDGEEDHWNKRTYNILFADI